MATSRANGSLATTIRRNVRDARVSRGLTQREVADLIGVESMAVSRWERGSQRPKDEHLDAYAEALSIPPVWFYTDHAVDEPDLEPAA